MPHYSIQEFIEPRFVQYGSYYLTWQDDSNRNVGPYGEPISSYQDDFFYEPSSHQAYPELVDFTGHFWNEHGLTDQAYKELHMQLQLPDNNWLSEYESYIDGPFDYEEQSVYNQSAFDYKQAAVYDYDIDEQSAYDYKSWLGNEFLLGYGIKEEGEREYERFHGENEASYSWKMYEMRLCDKIFGNWPPLSPTDNENPVAAEPQT